jgi:cell division protein FtsZ
MTDININIADYKTILAHKGKIEGIVDSCKIDELLNYIDQSLKDSLSNAKGILINFKLHKEQSLLIINDFMGEINCVANEDAEIIFSTEQTNNIDKDFISYQILITGL